MWLLAAPHSSSGCCKNAPEITSTPRNSVALGTSYFYTLNISDPDGDLLTINLQTAPTGMTLNQQGLITWTPEANQLGNHTVKVEVNDGRGGFAEQEWAIAVADMILCRRNAGK